MFNGVDLQCGKIEESGGDGGGIHSSECAASELCLRNGCGGTFYITYLLCYVCFATIKKRHVRRADAGVRNTASTEMSSPAMQGFLWVTVVPRLLKIKEGRRRVKRILRVFCSDFVLRYSKSCLIRGILLLVWKVYK